MRDALAALAEQGLIEVGFALTAAILMMFAGVIDILQGLAAIIRNHYYVIGAQLRLTLADGSTPRDHPTPRKRGCRNPLPALRPDQNVLVLWLRTSLEFCDRL